MTPRTSLPEAQRIIDRDYEALRPEVTAALRGKLAGHNVHVDPSDLDEYYNQAWHALYSQLSDGRKVDNPTGFLVVVAYRRAIEELRHTGNDTYHAELNENAGREEDLPELIDDQIRLRHLMQGMRERLNERERTAACLCLIHGYSRLDAAEVLGVSRKRIEKIMDGVQRKLATLTGEIDSGWCENRRSLVVAYSLGLLDRDGERYAAASEHLKDCSGCRRYVATSRGLAGAVAPVGFPIALASAGTASVGHGVAGRLPRTGRGKTLAAAGAVAAVAVVAAGAFAVAGGGDDGSAAPAAAASVPARDRAPGSAPSSSPASTPASSNAAGQERAAADRRAQRAAARRRAERRRRQAAAAAAPAPAPAVVPVAAPSVPEPAAPAPAAPEPAPEPAPAPKPKPEPVVTDGAQEFGPEQGASGGKTAPEPAEKAPEKQAPAEKAPPITTTPTPPATTTPAAVAPTSGPGGAPAPAAPAVP